jgi:TonB family protein
MKTFTLLLVVSLTSGVAFAQSSERRIAYLSKDRKVVSSPAQAAYRRTVQEAGEGFIVREYYMASGRLRLEAACIEYTPDIIYHGMVKRYYENGKLKEEGEYDEGYATGISTEYYESGSIRQRNEHQADDKTLILQYYTPGGRERLTDGSGTLSEITLSGDSSYSLIKNHVVVQTYVIHATDTVYGQVEKMAEFPGGMGALMKYLQHAVTYPPDARRNGLQGSVYTAFDIDKQGNITNISTVRGISDDLDEESIRVVRGMPRWTPARLEGRAVKSRYVLPIKFRLATRGGR